MHYKAYTSIGEKVCDVTELQMFIDIEILETAEYIATEEVFLNSSVEEQELITRLNKEQNFLRPTQNIVELPKSEQARNIRWNLNGVKIGLHKLDNDAILKAGLFCRHCGNHENHHYCSPNGHCVYMDKIKSIKPVNGVLDNYIIRYIVNPQPMVSARNKETCIMPVDNFSEGYQGLQLEGYFFIDVNGVMINPYSSRLTAAKAISEHMVCPWNNPLLDDAEKHAWTIYHKARAEFLEMKSNRSIKDDNVLVMMAIKKVRDQDKVYYNQPVFNKLIATGLNEEQEQDLNEFLKQKIEYKKSEKLFGSKWVKQIPNLPAKIYG